MCVKVTGILIPLLMSVCCISCGGDEPAALGETADSSQGGNASADAPVEEIVSEHTYVNSYYKGYAFTFNVSSTVRGELPSIRVEYAIGHGSVYSSSLQEMAVSVGEQAYSYTITTRNQVDNVTFRNPFWLYYAFVGADAEKLAMCEMYYNAYVELNKKSYSTLKSDEKALYNEATDYLNRCEREVTSVYRPVLYVVVNDKFYKLQTYQIP